MSEQLSEVDDAQLSRWAFGRASSPGEQVRAELAAVELHRRAIVERELSDRSAERDAVAVQPGGQGHSPKGEDLALPLTVAELRKRRRLRVTGTVGVISAVFAFGVVTQVQRGIDSDPLAIFDRPASQLDEEWAERLALDSALFVTAGPRVIDLGGGLDGIAVRLSTVPDGRSTAWDAYCLYLGRVDGADGWSLEATCTNSARFEEVGLSKTLRPSTGGEGYDNVVWGPVGPPRIESNVADRALEGQSFLDWMMVPNYIPLGRANPFENVNDPDRLLAGPRSAFGKPVIDGEELGAELYLLAGTDEQSEPELCLHAQHAAAEPVTACVAVSIAERDGLSVYLQIDGLPWLVSVTGNGTVMVRPPNSIETEVEG